MTDDEEKWVRWFTCCSQQDPGGLVESLDTKMCSYSASFCSTLCSKAILMSSCLHDQWPNWSKGKVNNNNWCNNHYVHLLRKIVRIVCFWTSLNVSLWCSFLFHIIVNWSSCIIFILEDVSLGSGTLWCEFFTDFSPPKKDKLDKISCTLYPKQSGNDLLIYVKIVVTCSANIKFCQSQIKSRMISGAGMWLCILGSSWR